MSAFDIAIELPELGPARPAADEMHVDVPARDGFVLAATLFQPRQRNGVAVVVSPAYATPRRYYGAYARYLASEGFTVLTFDFRGIAARDRRNPPRQPPTMRHWGECDLAGVVDWVGRNYPQLGLAVVGHSAGGQLLGLAGNNDRVAALLTVASQSGYWGLRDGVHRPIAWLYFHAIIPAMAHLAHRFRSLRRGPFAVPRGVALEFSRWGRHPDYVIDARGLPLREGFVRYAGAARFYHITDDFDYAPRRAVEALAAFYARARVEVVHRSPADWGVARIGHFGFFRPSMPRAAWQETAQWLLQNAAPRLRVVRARSVPIVRPVRTAATARAADTP